MVEQKVDENEKKRPDISVSIDVKDEMNLLNDLYEWSDLIDELSQKEIELDARKEAYERTSEKILEEVAKEKAENDNDIIKKLYGYNNDKTRKKYVKEVLKDDDKKIKDLEFSIDYLKRRIPFLKQLIHTKTVLMEVKAR